MPKNVKKGKNNKNKITTTRECVLKTEDQDYARVLRMFGSRRVECEVIKDSKKYLGIIRGSMRKGKKNKVLLNDIVLISYRLDFQTDSKVDIICVYNPQELVKLRKLGEIPKEIKANVDLLTFASSDEEDEADNLLIIDSDSDDSDSDD